MIQTYQTVFVAEGTNFGSGSSGWLVASVVNPVDLPLTLVISYALFISSFKGAPHAVPTIAIAMMEADVFTTHPNLRRMHCTDFARFQSIVVSSTFWGRRRLPTACPRRFSVDPPSKATLPILANCCV